MTSLFDGIAKMIGSLVRKPDEPVRFHTGGPVDLDRLARGRSQHFIPRGRISFQGNPLFGGRMADDLAQRQNGKRDFHAQISLSQPQTRKRPITDDMTQMCQDLGIEPVMSYEDFRKELEKTLAKAYGVPGYMLRSAGLPWKPIGPSNRERWPIG